MSKENQEKYSIDEFIMLLKEYDFKNNSIRKFANNYKISEKTVVKYLKK
jgi:transposase